MEVANGVFFSFVFVLGLLLAYSGQKVKTSLSHKCQNKAIKNSIDGVLYISAICIVSSLAYLICISRCNCTSAKTFGTELYILFVLVLGIVLIIFASIIKGGADECESSEAITVVLVLGILMTTSTIGYISYYYYTKQSAISSRKSRTGGSLKGIEMTKMTSNPFAM